MDEPKRPASMEREELRKILGLDMAGNLDLRRMLEAQQIGMTYAEYTEYLHSKIEQCGIKTWRNSHRY